MKTTIGIALTLTVLLGAGCESMPVGKQADVPINSYRTTSRLPQTVHRVAVLPLTSDDDVNADQGRDMLQPVLLSEIAKTAAFEMVAVSPEQLRAVTGRDGWSAQEVLPADFLARLQAATGCDAVLFCRLKQFRPYPPMAVGWDLRLVDASSHTLLWAVDEVLDSGKPAVASSARGYYEQAIHVPPPKGDPSSVLMSPDYLANMRRPWQWKPSPPIKVSYQTTDRYSMEVNPNTGTSAAQKVTAKPLVTPPVQAAAADSASFRQADAVNSALQQTPDVRADAVAKARALISDENFPPLSMVNAIAKFIATKLNQDLPQE